MKTPSFKALHFFAFVLIFQCSFAEDRPIKSFAPKVKITQAVAPAIKKTSLTIKVLLDELDVHDKQKLVFSSNKSIFVEHEDEQGKKKWPEKKLELLIQDNKLYALDSHKKKYLHIKKDSLTIHPISGKLTFKKNTYQGALTIKVDPHKKKLLFINKLNLDDYIYSVLRYESLSFWPLEMQKVQTVASRTYAVYQMRVNRTIRKNCPYDIKNTNHHQVYNGAHKCIHLRKAIQETHNQILTYNGSIALTMFDICCGGIIPWNMKKRDESKPYLFRKNKCSFCDKKSIKKWHQWKTTLTTKNFLDQLKKNTILEAKLKKMGILKNVKIWKKDKAGIVLSLILYGSKRNVLITRNQLDASLNEKFRSRVFTVKKEKNNITFDGFGYGHNTGLCQLGARELVRNGWNYKKILGFYFPDTKIARLMK